MISRRNFLHATSSVAGVSLFPKLGLSQEQGGDPNQFFLTILMDGGADPTYLFDARPLAMSNPDGGVLQNFIGEEPEVWGDSGPYSTYASALTQPLKKHKDRLAIINGVQMATSFDGHDQNTNFFLTGNPFGGAGFLPHLADAAPERRPLDYVQTDFLFAQINNGSASIQISPQSAAQLSQATSRLAGINHSHPNLAFAKASMRRAEGNRGTFANGARKMRESLEQVPSLVEQLSDLSVESGENQTLSKLNMISSFFRKGLTNHALMSLNSFGFDTHDAGSAMGQKDLFQDVVTQLDTIITYLLETPFDDNSSLFDHTTFILTSEFGRTMRQPGLPLDATGTDHNPLTNSFILGGGKVRGGQIFGASDFRSNDDPLDGAHLELDPGRIKMMGRPFDFASGQAIADAMETYQVGNYLTCNSLVNTIYDHVGADKSHYRLTERNGVIAPSIPGLFG